jgi:pimeloyl-ACP methyl ester carboxylesterase
MRAVIEPAMAEGGPRHAMEMFIRGNAGDEVADQWFESLDATDRDRILENGAVFFPIELPAFAAFMPDREGMRASGVALTVAVGVENRDTWYGAAAAWLAEGTGADLVELPGGHGGFVSHPQEFIELVRRIVG